MLKTAFESHARVFTLVLVCSSCGSGPDAIVTTSGNPAFLVVTGGQIYWTDDFSGQVLSVSSGAPAGSNPAVVASGGLAGPAPLTQAGPWLVWANQLVSAADGGGIGVVAVPLADVQTTPLVVATTQTGGYGGLGTDGTSLFWTDAFSGEVWSLPLLALADGGATPTLIHRQAGSSPASIVSDGTEVWWADEVSGSVFAQALGQGADAGAETIWTGMAPNALVVDASSLYWTDRALGQVFSKPTDGGSAVAIVSGQPGAWALAIDGADVDWTAEGVVVRSTVVGQNLSVLASHQLYPYDVAVDPESVYWTDRLGGTIERLRK